MMGGERCVRKDGQPAVKINCFREHSFIGDRFDRRSVLVDLGAHKGEFTELTLEHFHFGRAILVEANPELIPEIEARTRVVRADSRFRNSGAQIEIVHAAVGPVAKPRVQFYVSNNIEASSYDRALSESSTLKDGPEVWVEMITLEDIFERFRLGKIDLLKMDIEGAEWDIIERFGLRDFARIEQISVEFHDFLNKDHARSERCVAKLKKLGYKVAAKPGEYRFGTKYMDTLFYK